VAQEILQGAGLIVTVVNNGQEGVDAAKQNQYDAILMDIQMPVMDGYTATGKIRESEQFADLPILAMTANALAEDKERAIQAGMNDHIAKPIDPAELFATLVKWLKPGASVVKTESLQSKEQPPGRQKALPAELPGLDIQRGITQVGGNEVLYTKLLREFLIDHKGDVTELEQAVFKKDFETGQRLAHTLKGLGGTIGAFRLSQISEMLETAFKEKSSDALESSLPEFKLAMTELLAGLEKNFSNELRQDNTESDFETADIIASAEQLEKMLEEMDPEAEEVAIQLKKMLRKSPDLKRVASTLVKQVSGFEFEHAQDSLDIIKNTFKDS
jgi:CheY-like chemotaxis protein